MTLPEAIAEVRQVGSLTLASGKVKVRFPEAERSRLAPALAVLRANREAVIDRLTAEAEIAPLADDDPEVWKAHPYRGEKELDAFIRRMEAQRDWWKARPAQRCSLCRGPLGDPPKSGYFIPPADLTERLGKPANTVISVMLCATCFARPDREAAMERSILNEHQAQ
jgi:hypothetical protein